MTGLASESSVGIRSSGRDGGGGGEFPYEDDTRIRRTVVKVLSKQRRRRWSHAGLKRKTAILQAFLFIALHD